MPEFSSPGYNTVDACKSERNVHLRFRHGDVVEGTKRFMCGARVDDRRKRLAIPHPDAGVRRHAHLLPRGPIKKLGGTYTNTELPLVEIRSPHFGLRDRHAAIAAVRTDSCGDERSSHAFFDHRRRATHRVGSAACRLHDVPTIGRAKGEKDGQSFHRAFSRYRA